jgi:hypothetical protein
MNKTPHLTYERRKAARRKAERDLITYMDNALGINTRWRRIQAPLYPKSRQCQANLTYIARKYGRQQASQLREKRRLELEAKFAGQRQYLIDEHVISIQLTPVLL